MKLGWDCWVCSQQRQQQTKAAKGAGAAFHWLEKLEGADSAGESELQIQLSAL